MKRTALIGLGQSGSAIVEDLYTYLNEFNVYCINSSEINEHFLKIIPPTNRYCFGLNAGFAKDFEKALNHLEKYEEQGILLLKWVEKIISEHDETIFVTYTGSGTGVGTLIYLLSKLKGDSRNYTYTKRFVKGVILQERYTLRTLKSNIEKIKLREWLYLSLYELTEEVLLVESSNQYRLFEDMPVDLKLPIFAKAGRLTVLDTLRNQRYYDKNFLTNSRRNFLYSTLENISVLD